MSIRCAPLRREIETLSSRGHRRIRRRVDPEDRATGRTLDRFLTLAAATRGDAFAQHLRQSADRDRDLRLTGADRRWPEVYMTAEAKALTGSDIDREIEVFSRRSVAQGGPGGRRTMCEVMPPIRLYRAPALSHSMLAKDGKPDHRIMVDIRGRHSSR